MKQVFGLLALVFALGFSAPAALAQTFEVGQVWSLNAPMAETARIYVGRVEDDGQTVHIQLWGQPIDSPGLGSPLTAGHLPISSEALAGSVRARVDEMPPSLAQFEEGYAEWRRAQGGVFTISVTEIIDVLIEVWSRRPAHVQ